MEAHSSGEIPAVMDAVGVVDLYDAERLHQTFFELMNEGALTINATGNIILCNSCFAMMMRESIDQLRGTRFYNLLTAESRDRVSETLRLGTAETYEGFLLSGYGEKLPVHLSLTPVVEIDTCMTYIVVTDLRSHRANVEALRKSEEFSKATLNSISSGIAVLGRDGTIIAVNKSWQYSGSERSGQGSEGDNGIGVGVNYISVWAKAVKASHPRSQEAIDGINSVLSGDIPDFRLDYPWYSSDEVRWFTMAVTPLGADRHGVVVSNREITRWIRAEENIKKALDEKAMLLRELYHRTKNNMSVIIAMLHMQSSNFDNERMKQAFTDAENRISSMALVHEKLYDAKNLTQIDLREYIEELLNLLIDSYKVDAGDLNISLELDEVYLHIDSAIPCGLILNELISNILKYAFKAGTAGEIKIVLHQDDDSGINLRVQDNGRGVPDGFDFRRDGNLGLQTIFLLGESQLNGKVEFHSENGVECSFAFRDKHYQKRM